MNMPKSLAAIGYSREVYPSLIIIADINSDFSLVSLEMEEPSLWVMSKTTEVNSGKSSSRVPVRHRILVMQMVVQCFVLPSENFFALKQCTI